MQHGITTSDSDIDPSSYDLRKGSKIGALITSANIYRKNQVLSKQLSISNYSSRSHNGWSRNERGA